MTEKTGDIKEFPENYQDMVDKLNDREREQLEKLLEKRNVKTKEELADIAKKAIVTRSLRARSEYETLKSHTILYEPKSEEIKSLKQKLEQETAELVKAIFQQYPHLRKPGALKGRVSLGDEKVAEPSRSGGG